MSSFIAFFLFLFNLVISVVSVKKLAQQFKTERATWNGAIITLVLNIIFSILAGIVTFIASLAIAFLFDGGHLLIIIASIIVSLLASGKACAIGVRTTLLKGTGIIVLNYIIVVLIDIIIIFILMMTLGATVLTDLQNTLNTDNPLSSSSPYTTNSDQPIAQPKKKKEPPKKFLSFTEKQRQQTPQTSQYYPVTITDVPHYKGYYIRISRYNDEPLVGQLIELDTNSSQLVIQQNLYQGSMIRYVPLSTVQTLEVYK